MLFKSGEREKRASGKIRDSGKRICCILMQKFLEILHRSKDVVKKIFPSKIVHYFRSEISGRVFPSKINKIKWLMVGGIGVVIFFSLWQVRIHWCSIKILARGREYLSQQDTEKAMESFKKAIEFNPKLLEGYLYLSELYLKEREPSRAVELLLKASKVFPNNPKLLSTLKKAYQEELRHSPYILKVGIKSELTPLTTLKVVQPLLSRLSRNLNCRIELSLFSGYEVLAKYLQKGEIDIAILGPEDLMNIEYQEEITPLFLVSSNKESTQRSVIVTSEQDIYSLKQLEGKSFAFGKKDSLTGFILPQMTLLERGINPLYFSRVYYMNSQEEVFYSLLEKRVDAGALAEHIFNYLTSTENISPKMRILARSTKVPADVLVARKNISPELLQKVKDLLLNYPESKNSQGIFRQYSGISLKEEVTRRGKIYTVIFAEF